VLVYEKLENVGPTGGIPKQSWTLKFPRQQKHINQSYTTTILSLT
jgi:hypothetical protein